MRAAACLDGLEQVLENGDLPPAFNPEPNACPVLSGVEPVKPIQTVDELIDAASHLLEVIEDPEQLERVIDGLLRLGGETTDRFEEKTEGLRTRGSTGRGTISRRPPLSYAPSVIFHNC